MAAPGDNARSDKKRPPEHSSSPPSERSASDRKPTGKRPEEIEPLDEKSLEQVMRDCPL
jgi:hypothetical protein